MKVVTSVEFEIFILTCIFVNILALTLFAETKTSALTEEDADPFSRLGLVGQNVHERRAVQRKESAVDDEEEDEDYLSESETESVRGEIERCR